MNNPFDEAMEDLAELAVEDPRLKVLDQFCQGVETHTKGGVECHLERGYTTNLGQEWRVVAKSSSHGGPEYALLRAHLAPRGECHLDLYDADLEKVSDAPALE